MANIFQRQGLNISDREVIEEFGLDPNTKDVDKAAFDVIEQQNTRQFVSEGHSEKEAAAMARKQRSDAMRKADLGAKRFS